MVLVYTRTLMSLLINSTELEKNVRTRLKRIRIDVGFPTAKEFAEKVGLKTSTYALHEAGTRRMSLKVIEHYANLLNIEPNWLLTGLGPKFKK